MSSSPSSWLGMLVSRPRSESPCLDWLRMCRELQRRVPNKAFKEVDVTYVPGAVVGRQRRRSLVHRLQVQHAVCMLMNLKGRDGLMSVEEALKMLGQERGRAVWDWANERALEQEKAIFGRGKGPALPVYSGAASRASALDWWEDRFKEKGGEDHRVEDAGDDQGDVGSEDQRRRRPDRGKRKADLEERTVDFDEILIRNRQQRWRRAKRVVMDLIDDQMVGSLAPERKVSLLEDVQAVYEREREQQENETQRCSDEQLRAMLAPIVLRVTEPVRHVQKLQFTKL